LFSALQCFGEAIDSLASPGFILRRVTDRERRMHEPAVMRTSPVSITRFAHLALLPSLCLAGLPGCADRSVASLDPAQVGEVLKDIPVNADIDLLFVIDDSGSTRDKQTVFAANFPRFVQALDAFEKGRPNLHIGVVSTSVDLGVPNIGGCPHPAPNDNGLLHNEPSSTLCTGPSDRFIVDISDGGGGRRTNYTGELSSALSCIAQLGAEGCGFEAPLEAMKRALDGTRPENAGFLRKNAFLVVVFLVDEDDASIGDPAFFTGEPPTSDFRAQPLHAYQCDQPISATSGGNYTGCRARTDSFLTDPARYHEFLSTIKPAGRTVVALIGGDPKQSIATGALDQGGRVQPLALQPTCSATINGSAAIGRPAIRLADFTSRFGDHGLIRSICQPDYSQTLSDIGALIGTAISPCLEGDLATADRDPDEPGTQLECNVSDAVLEPVATETQIPRCRMTAPDQPAAGGGTCWWTKSNPAACGTTATELELHVERATPPAPGTSVRVRCATRGA
jgi:hypothetical protein